MNEPAFTPGQLVRLTRTTKELTADGLRIGQIGTIAVTPDGALGVEFAGYSDAGRRTGLKTITIRTREDDGTIVLITDLCERTTNNGKT